MPENGQASTAPIVLTISSASGRGGPFARMEPAFQLPQELIDTAGQTDKLLIIARAMKGFHLLAEYTSAVCPDVPNRYFNLRGCAEIATRNRPVWLNPGTRSIALSLGQRYAPKKSSPNQISAGAVGWRLDPGRTQLAGRGHSWER